jgi:lipoate-protein ligase A
MFIRDRGECVEAFSKGFEDALNITLEPLELTSEQIEFVMELERKKYANNDWTFKK